MSTVNVDDYFGTDASLINSRIVALEGFDPVRRYNSRAAALADGTLKAGQKVIAPGGFYFVKSSKTYSPNDYTVFDHDTLDLQIVLEPSYPVPCLEAYIADTRPSGLFAEGAEIYTQDGYTMVVVTSGEDLTTGGGTLLSVKDDATEAHVGQFGVFPAGNGATPSSNSEGLTRAIAWLNADTFRTLRFGSGLYAIREPIPAITGTQKKVAGSGFQTTRLRMDSDQTSGNFFSIGDGGTTTTARVDIEGFSIVHQRDVGVSGYAFDIDGATDVMVADIRTTNIAGLARVGNTSKSSRVTIRDIYGGYNSALDHIVGDFKRWTNLTVKDVILYGQDGGAGPRTATTWNFEVVGLCDTLIFEKVEGFPTESAARAIYCNADDGAMVNCWFNNCVFDKHGVGEAAVDIEITSSSNATSGNLWRVRHWFFEACRFDTGGDNPGGKGIRISQGASNTYSSIQDIKINSCEFTCRDDAAITLVQTGTDQMDGILICGNSMDAVGSTAKTAAIEVGCSNVRIIGNECNQATESGITKITNFVDVTDNGVGDLVVSGNDWRSGCDSLIDHASYTTMDRSRSVTGNMQPPRQEFTIASGAITLSGLQDDDQIIVDTESDAASDFLNTINGAHRDGQMLTITAADNARTIQVATGGNIDVASAPRDLTHTRDILRLMYDDVSSAWLEVSFADNQA